MLGDLQKLDEFLDTIYASAPCKISVKTRLGLDDPDEFEGILEVYKRYPISELIIHPRIRRDFYRHPVRKDVFDKIYRDYQASISYNGSIVTPQDWKDCIAQYPNLHAVMIGQGLVADPFLAAKIKHNTAAAVQLLQEFHDRLFDGYAEQFQSRNNAAKRMKEFWFYLSRSFEGSESYLKKLQKSKSAEEYLAIAHQIFKNTKLLPHSTGNW